MTEKCPTGRKNSFILIYQIKKYNSKNLSIKCIRIVRETTLDEKRRGVHLKL